jgi:ectoine hydroxylase-related dioxygenase (phytanoyl-CoA dioxygenase family)
MTLTDAQRTFYAENGYLVLERLIPDAQLVELRRTIAAFRERARTIGASDPNFDVAPGHSAATPKLRRLKDPVLRDPVFDRLMRDPLVVEPVADLLGGTVRFDHSKLNFKPAGGEAQIDWHQDWAFYPHTNDDLLAVGVMVEECTAENGPLMVIPGSHRGPVYDHHSDGLFVGGIAEADLGAETARAVSLTAPAGSISIHHVRTLHASKENRTEWDRPLLLYSYSAVDAFPVFETRDLAEYDALILKGEPTRAPRATGVPMRLPLPRQESADSIYDNQAGRKKVA